MTVSISHNFTGDKTVNKLKTGIIELLSEKWYNNTLIFNIILMNAINIAEMRIIMKEINIKELNESVCKMIGDDWMLVTAARDGKVNTMTASWGGLGVMWGKNVAFIVIRPQRYTKEFIDAADTLSLTFYSSDRKKDLSYLGSVSGRDEDKISKVGYTVAYEGDTPYFEEAEKVMIVKKLYAQEYRPECFIDKEAEAKWYENKDYHTMYICEIEKVMVK